MHRTRHRRRGAGQAGPPRRRAGAKIAATLAVTVAASLAQAIPASASVVIAGGSWLGGQGVDVCVPAYDSCGNNVTTTTGYGFQCVDLPQRLYYKLGWYGRQQFAGVAYAYQIYGDAGSLGFQAHANGGGYIPVPGDMIVEAGTSSNSAGHVAVVDHVSGGSIYATEENASPTGWHTYHLSGSAITGGYGSVLGSVHAPADHLGAPPPPPPATHQASQAVAQPDGTVDEFFRGTDNNLWHTFYKASSPGWQPVNVLANVAGTGGQMASEPSAVVSSPGLVDVFWKGADNNLWHVFYNPASGWSSPSSLGDGPLGGPPRAVAQSNGVVDVFWQSSGHDAIYHAFYSPSSGWSSPSSLGAPPPGGAPAGDPSPVVSSPGLVDVFWRGVDNNLWHAFYQPGDNTWYPPSSLGMGPLGGAPAATGQSDGTIDVFWQSSGHDALYHAFYKASTGWQGPAGLGSTSMASDPMAVTSSPGVVDAFWLTTDGSLGHVFYRPDTGWSAVGTLPMGVLGGAPYASGEPNGTEDVFWKGSGATPQLWHAFYKNDGNGWEGPGDFGGSPA